MSPAASAGGPGSSSNGYLSSPFAGVDFNKHIGNGGPPAEPGTPSVFDPPNFVSVPPPPAPPGPPNDGSMVGALQELHNAPPPEPPRSRPDLPPGLDVPGREPLPSRNSGDNLSPVRDPLPSRGEGLPSRGSSAGLTPNDPLPAREPLPARNAMPPTEPIAVPGPGHPGSTGFLPDLNAVFNPPPAPPEPPAAPAPGDDLPAIDAPPPPPPPGGFDHLQQDLNGIPIEPGSRPSEWGRGVFEPEDEFSSGDQHPRAPFGRRG
jgi:hypothetical protein